MLDESLHFDASELILELWRAIGQFPWSGDEAFFPRLGLRGFSTLIEDPKDVEDDECKSQTSQRPGMAKSEFGRVCGRVDLARDNAAEVGEG